MKNSVQVVCHKGANKIAPENTYAAARPCLDWGVDYVEIDVHTSADGIFYIFHGPYLQRTTNGSGWIGALTAAEIDRLDAGSWFSPAFAGERVPRLAEYLRWLQGRAKVFLDVKNADPLALAQLVSECGYAESCFFWSSDPDWMQRLHTVAPHLALKVNVRDAAGAAQAKRELNARIVEVGLEHLTSDLLAACHALGQQVMVLYAGNDPASFEHILASGADLINTDYGDEFLAAARRFAARQG